MKTAVVLIVFALCGSLTTAAQVFSNGGCGCRLSGTTVRCQCGSALSTIKQEFA